MEWSWLPTLNALLNTTSAILLACGYRSIRKGNRTRHRNLMLGACVTSTLFLISYLTYHYQAGSRSYPGTGSLRSIYLSILLTHTVLAAAMVPLVLLTLSRALRADYPKHRRVARFTLPIWIYVSVTGVVIYLMLYGIGV